MKKSSLRWTLLILAAFTFFGADRLFSENFALAMKVVCIAGACADVYFLSVSYEKAVSAFLKRNEEAYGHFMDEVRKLCATQEELVAKEKEVRDMNAKVLKDINAAVNGFVQISGNVKDEVAALKAYMKVFMDRTEANLEEHYEKMEELGKDGNDELQGILETFGKKQVKALSDQTEELKECVGQIEDAVCHSIGEVTEQNNRLLLDLERMQDEWTDLNKTEIEFLNRIWEE